MRYHVQVHRTQILSILKKETTTTTKQAQYISPLGSLCCLILWYEKQHVLWEH